MGRTQCAAAGMRDRAEARCAVGDHDARQSTPLAFVAHAGVRHVGVASGQEGCDHLEELPPVEGQPCSSKSTRTCAEIGVDVARVSMYSGLAYTAAANSATLPKLRNACTPPAVRARADGDQVFGGVADPVDAFDVLLRGVTDPSTRDRS